jgi:transposase
MAAPIALRADYDGTALRRLARRSDDADQTRRLLALAVIYDGGLRGAAAEVGGVGAQTIRDWVLHFNTRGPEGLIDTKHPGPRPKLTAEQRAALVRRVEAGPRPAVDGVVRWRLKDLVAWVQADYGITMDETTLSRTLRALGYRKLSARPRHYAQDPEDAAAFKKTSPRW